MMPADIGVHLSTRQPGLGPVLGEGAPLGDRAPIGVCLLQLRLVEDVGENLAFLVFVQSSCVLRYLVLIFPFFSVQEMKFFKFYWMHLFRAWLLLCTVPADSGVKTGTLTDGLSPSSLNMRFYIQ